MVSGISVRDWLVEDINSHGFVEIVAIRQIFDVICGLQPTVHFTADLAAYLDEQNGGPILIPEAQPK